MVKANSYLKAKPTVFNTNESAGVPHRADLFISTTVFVFISRQKGNNEKIVTNTMFYL